MKKKTNIVFGLFAIVILAFGIVNFADANTYQFINTSGQVGYIVADNPQEAISDAYNRGLHSGVILFDEQTNIDPQRLAEQGLYLYQFVNTSGQAGFIWSDNPQEAISDAYNRGLHSGVILIK